jgi:hypothetical protein
VSPAPRGRRPKKGGKRKPRKSRADAVRLPAGPPGSALATLARTLGDGEWPEWFDGAIERVLAGADMLTMTAVVVRFSRTRKRYERQGLLVEPDALEPPTTAMP